MLTGFPQNIDGMRFYEKMQEYLHKSSQLFTLANGVQPKRVDVDFYENITEEDISKQLKIVIELIYLNEAKHCAGKEVVKACFEKLLKQSGMFSDREVEVLLL